MGSAGSAAPASAMRRCLARHEAQAAPGRTRRSSTAPRASPSRCNNHASPSHTTWPACGGDVATTPVSPADSERGTFIDCDLFGKPTHSDIVRIHCVAEAAAKLTPPSSKGGACVITNTIRRQACRTRASNNLTVLLNYVSNVLRNDDPKVFCAAAMVGSIRAKSWGCIQANTLRRGCAGGSGGK